MNIITSYNNAQYFCASEYLLPFSSFSIDTVSPYPCFYLPGHFVFGRGVFCPRGVLAEGVSVQGGFCPRWAMSKVGFVQGGLCPRGIFPNVLYVLGGFWRGGVLERGFWRGVFWKGGFWKGGICPATIYNILNSIS